MTAGRIGAVAAVLGGLAWIAEFVLVAISDGARAGTAAVDAVHVAGAVLLLVAFAGWGYNLVATAPVWLRAIVAVAYPLLAATVYQLLDTALSGESPVDETALATVFAELIFGVLTLLVGVIALARSRGRASRAPQPAPSPPPRRGSHRG